MEPPPSATQGDRIRTNIQEKKFFAKTNIARASIPSVCLQDKKFLCKGMPSRQLSKDKPKKVLPPEQGHAFKTIEQGHAFKTIEQGQTFTSTHLSKTPTHLRKDKLISVANGKCLSKDKLIIVWARTKCCQSSNDKLNTLEQNFNTFKKGQTYKCCPWQAFKQRQTQHIWARTNV